MEERNFRTYYVFVVALFVCILFSFSVFYIAEDIIGQGSGISESCYDGSVIQGSDPIRLFLRSVYHDEDSLSLVRKYEYRIFGIVNDQNVIAGKEDFLFEIKDQTTGYDYLEDYIGQSAFTEEECAAILSELTRRQEKYLESGAEYLLVIIPNCQTVYSEYMPSYLGSISKNTRLSCLSDYLEINGFTAFEDLTEELRAAKSAGRIYNNTENSLSALGVYYAYRAVYGRFSERVRAATTLTPKENLSFRQYMTTGKSIAKQAGLEETVLNYTVSLSNDTAVYYTYLLNTGNVTKTSLKPAIAQGQNSSLLLQFSQNWERLQSEPFFSNTFHHVTYQLGLSEDETIYEEAHPFVVIQFIYESELASLLPASD